MGLLVCFYGRCVLFLLHVGMISIYKSVITLVQLGLRFFFGLQNHSLEKFSLLGVRMEC